MFGSTGVTGFNIWSLFVAVIGSVVMLVVYHALIGGRSSRVQSPAAKVSVMDLRPSAVTATAKPTRHGTRHAFHDATDT
jgi:hypothetical protein